MGFNLAFKGLNVRYRPRKPKNKNVGIKISITCRFIFAILRVLPQRMITAVPNIRRLR